MRLQKLTRADVIAKPLASSDASAIARNEARYFLSLARSSAKAMAPPGFGSTRPGLRVGSGGRRSRGPRGAPVFVSARASLGRDPLPGASSSRIVSEMRCRFSSTSSTLDLDDLAGLDDFVRVLDEFIRQRGHMDETILVHTDIDEGAKGGDIGHDAFENHTRLQVGE